MRVALVETDTVWEDPGANRRRMARLSLDADVAVFPELSFSGFTMNPLPDPEAEPFLISLARDKNMSLVAGYIGDGPTNVAAAVCPDEGIVARYRKMHPFSHAGEHKAYRPGDDLPLFDLHGFSAAMLICYDLRFPEAFREAALRGANLFFVPANWPAARATHWRALLVARAIENQAFVIGVNRIGSDPDVEYAGGSLVVDPAGEILHEGSGVDSIAPESATTLRREFPALDDVRRDRYGWIR
ncbi:MAG: carbon-nitrogen family hydrolase [Planctomycetota bacterium]|nr:carbon-nitrogen family hydrolase [Planctomycetota bacterium]